MKTYNKVAMKFATKVYVKKGELYELSSNFQKKAVETFSSEVESIDFSDKEAANKINSWVR